MSLETTVFTFKISVPFEEWTAVYEGEENIEINKKRGIISHIQGKKERWSNQFNSYWTMKEGKSGSIFKVPAFNPLIDSAGHIYDSTIISSYFKLRVLK